MTIVRSSKAIRYSHAIYQFAPLAFKAILLVLYGLKCFLALGWARAGEPKLAFFSPFPNEKQVLSHVRNNLDELDHNEFTISLRHCIRLSVLANLTAFALASPRLYRYARKLARRHAFMPACRIFITVAYYMRFKRLLAGGDVEAVFIASQYSSECLGLAAAAHLAGKKIVFANHANAISETEFIAPIYADAVIVTNQALADVYQRHTRRKLNIIPFPIATPQGPMTVPDSNSSALVAGVYLTGLTNEFRLQEMVAELLRVPMIESVFVRPHPVQMVNPDLSNIADGQGRMEISRNRPLREDIERTDIAVCGNSSVTVELLRAGKPLLYDTRLDHYVDDAHEFAERGLVLVYPEPINGSVSDQLRQHYENKTWLEIMRYYDFSYQRDEKAMVARLNSAVEALLQAPIYTRSR